MYTLDVAEVIHSEWPLSQSINVCRYGGDIDEGVRVKRIVESDFPAFMPGREYVMFLLWNNILNGFELKFGADSAYEVMPNGTITTHGRSRLAHAQSGRSAAAMIAVSPTTSYSTLRHLPTASFLRSAIMAAALLPL